MKKDNIQKNIPVELHLLFEHLDNGYIVNINGRRYFCGSRLEFIRRLWSHLEGTIPKELYGAEHRAILSNFHLDKTVGNKEKEILEIIERDGFSTYDKLFSEMTLKEPSKHKYKIKMSLKNRLSNLVRKGFLSRKPNSDKYHLTDKRPEGYIVKRRPNIEMVSK